MVAHHPVIRGNFAQTVHRSLCETIQCCQYNVEIVAIDKCASATWHVSVITIQVLSFILFFRFIEKMIRFLWKYDDDIVRYYVFHPHGYTERNDDAVVDSFLQRNNNGQCYDDGETVKRNVIQSRRALMSGKRSGTEMKPKEEEKNARKHNSIFAF